MAYIKDSKSAAVRAQLDHPVIDGDGHWLEPVPIFLDYLRQVGGPAVVERFIHKAREAGWYEMGPQERLDRRYPSSHLVGGASAHAGPCHCHDPAVIL